MSKTPQISPAEWKVMKVLWTRSPQTSPQVIEALESAKRWHPNTIKTMLVRLVHKGALAVDKRKDPYEYRIAATEAVCIRAESQSFLEQVFDGSVKRLLLHFVEKQKMTAKDIEELQQILKSKA